jgi:dTDP-4-dehydrorhamnose reductase
MRILVVGATGLLGNVLVRVLSERQDWYVMGACRSAKDRHLFSENIASRLLMSGNLESAEELLSLKDRAAPDLVVNCAGARDLKPLQLERALSIYSILPRRLAYLCGRAGARLVHISSDGVFSGARGGYVEEDLPDATDIYGTTKFLGELSDRHAVTLRLSMIGPELKGKTGLLEWFLAKEGQCQCYSRSIFSGLPTVEIGRVIRDYVVPRPELTGVYHVAAEPISKLDLLTLIADKYGKNAEIIPDDSVVIDRSLNAARFNTATGYRPHSWPELIGRMHSYSFGLAG